MVFFSAANVFFGSLSSMTASSNTSIPKISVSFSSIFEYAPSACQVYRGNADMQASLTGFAPPDGIFYAQIRKPLQEALHSPEASGKCGLHPLHLFPKKALPAPARERLLRSINFMLLLRYHVFAYLKSILRKFPFFLCFINVRVRFFQLFLWILPKAAAVSAKKYAPPGRTAASAPPVFQSSPLQEKHGACHAGSL